MKEKSDNLIKTPTKIQSFGEVQKALQDLAKQLNDLGIATNSSAEGEITDKDGKTGDIRVTQNADKTYGLELKTEEGWKFPTVGESPVQLTSKKAEKARPDAVVDKFKDELGSPKNLPAPDYNSGWVTWDWSAHRVHYDAPLELTHSLGVISSVVMVHFAPGQASNAVTWFTCANQGLGNNHYSGIATKITSASIKLHGGDSYTLLGSDFSGSGDQRVEYQDGSVRILLWK